MKLRNRPSSTCIITFTLQWLSCDSATRKTSAACGFDVVRCMQSCAWDTTIVVAMRMLLANPPTIRNTSVVPPAQIVVRRLSYARHPGRIRVPSISRGFIRTVPALAPKESLSSRTVSIFVGGLSSGLRSHLVLDRTIGIPRGILGRCAVLVKQSAPEYGSCPWLSHTWYNVVGGLARWWIARTNMRCRGGKHFHRHASKSLPIRHDEYETFLLL